MKDKVLIPAVALVLAIGLGIGLWLILRDPTLRPAVSGNQPTDPDGPPVRQRANSPAGEREYNLNTASADPVQVDRPQPFRAPETLFRLEVSGRVIDENGLAVPDARVRFVGEGALNDIHGSACADQSGRYTLVAWSPRGTKPGTGKRTGRVVAQDADERSGVTPATDLPETEHAEMPDVVLAGVSEVRGRIQDPAGLPATGVTVIVRSTTPHESVPAGLRVPRVQQAFVTRAATTDSRGEFRLRGLRPGKYMLDVERSWHGTSAGAVEVDVPASGAAWVEPQLKASDAVRGRVVDSDGQPMAGAVVRIQTQSGAAPVRAPGIDQPLRLENADDSFRVQGDRSRREAANLRGGLGSVAVTDADGRFGFFNLQDVAWKVSTRVGESAPVLEELQINRPDITLTVKADSSLSGVVRDAETGAAIEYFDLRLVAGGDERTNPFERVATDRALAWHPRGLWRVVNPKAGNLVRVSAHGYSSGLLKVEDLAPGRSVQNLEIRLSPLCSLTLALSHEGRRLDLEPVLLLFDNGIAFEASSDTAGLARFGAVAATTYTVNVITRDGTRLEGKATVPARAMATIEVELSRHGGK